MYQNKKVQMQISRSKKKSGRDFNPQLCALVLLYKFDHRAYHVSSITVNQLRLIVWNENKPRNASFDV